MFGISNFSAPINEIITKFFMHKIHTKKMQKCANFCAKKKLILRTLKMHISYVFNNAQLKIQYFAHFYAISCNFIEMHIIEFLKYNFIIKCFIHFKSNKLHNFNSNHKYDKTKV